MKNNNVSNMTVNNLNRQTCDRILLAVDAHASFYVISRKIDATLAQAPKRIFPEEFVGFAEKQKELAKEIHVVYEAGCFGFSLARELLAKGINCYVVAPKKLDPYSKQVRTDKSDVRELLSDLDRYLSGNTRALRVVRIPTVQEELVRAEGRQRDQLCKDLRRLATRGRCLLLQFGTRVSNQWWTSSRWTKIRPKVAAPEIVEMLERLRAAIEHLAELIGPLERKLVNTAPKKLPVGFGKLTFVLLLREVINWSRFKTRRNVGGFTGLCGGVLQSGSCRQDLGITKAGHTRLRTLLIELAWRFVRFQANCPLIKKWQRQLQKAAKNKSRRKQIIVAIARQLAIDIWKWQTGRATPEQLGWLCCA